MKKIKHSIAIAAIVMLIASCGDKAYPDLEDGLYAEFVTNKDTMVAKLFFEKTPVTVANFVALAEGVHPMVSEQYKGRKFYDSTTFHRVINNFMIQGGDPTATGSGSPGYKFIDEFDNTLKHDKPGILSMANSGPATNGSQFFITEKPTPHLDAYQADGTLKICNTQPGGSCHTVFGELVKGLNVQDSISNVGVGSGNKPIEDVIILELNIIRKGFAARKFNAAKTWETELPLLEEREKLRKEEATKIAKEKAEEANKIAKENAAAAAEVFVNTNAKKGSVKRFPSGLALVTIKKGTQVKPKAIDSVMVNFSGFLENGKIFATSWKDVAKANNIYNEQGDQQGAYSPFSTIFNETATLIPGVREALLSMNVGDKVKVFIPSYLGYGPQGAGRGIIPPNTNLIYDIELVGIKK